MSFEPIAEWWDARVGSEGDKSHRHTILPAMLRIFGDVNGRRILDLGCGNGSSSRWLASAGAIVHGVEIAPSLVTAAKRREQNNRLGITYTVGNASDLSEFGDDTYDAVQANMVLMDAEDGSGLLREAARVLRQGGQFVLSITHPCFNIAGGSSRFQETDHFGTNHSVRVWRYLDPFSAEGTVASGQPVPHTYYHRPLSWYSRVLRSAGLVITHLDEPVPDDEFAEANPDSYDRQLEVPWFLIIGTVKT